MDHLWAIKVFRSVVDAQSYTKAAHQLGFSRSHISKQIKELEDSIGARLLNRTTQKVRPTEQGMMYYETCTRILSDLEQVELSLGEMGRAPRGPLKVLAPKALAVFALVPIIRDFNLRYPDVEVLIYNRNTLLNLVEHGFDVALRLGEQLNSSLIGRRICTVPQVVCAAPGYLRERGVPKHPNDLMQHECLRHLTYGRESTWTFHSPEGELSVEVHGKVAGSSSVFIRECVLNGCGISILPLYTIKQDIIDGTVVPLLTGYTIPEQPLFAIFPYTRPAKVSLFVDFVASRLSDRKTASRFETMPLAQ